MTRHALNSASINSTFHSNRLVDWCSNRIFSYIHNNKLIYNACWEDPRLDRVALKLGTDDTLLTITSAGCNVLDYALDNPKHIYAVDVNPKQNALLELKIAGIRALDFDTFFQIFGRGRHPNFPNLYKKELRPQLSELSAKHWDRHLNYFSSALDSSGFYFHGASGYLARWMNHYIDFKRMRDSLTAIFEAGTIEEQSYIYRHSLDTAFWTDLLNWILQWDLPYALAGVPRVQRQQVETGYVGGMRKFIQDRIETVFARLSLRDNYFWWLYVNGEYSPGRCPEYLKQENFLALKNGLVNKISIHSATLSGFLSQLRDTISRFVLLDHMDWLSRSLQHLLQEEWQLFINTARPGARFLWRSAGLNPCFIDPVKVRFNNEKVTVGQCLIYNHEMANALHAKDRVQTYGSFAIADLARI